jgi:hypothetical protein
LAGKFNQLSGRPLYGTYADGRASLSNSYAPMRTLTIEIFKVLLRGILWSSLAICVLAALFYGIASWFAGS